MTSGRSIIEIIAERQDLDQFRKKNWEGSFEEYLDLVRGEPKVTRNAFERVYDMIMSYGTDSYEEGREKRLRYHFFQDPDGEGADAVFGLEDQLAVLVNAFKSAAQGYGIEKRVLLLHGPVGSSKSTIARLLKKGLERYSARDEGALYTLGWVDLEDAQQRPLVPDERGAAAHHSGPVPRRRRSEPQRRAVRRRVPREDQGRAVPVLPLRLQRAAQALLQAIGRASCRTCASSV